MKFTLTEVINGNKPNSKTTFTSDKGEKVSFVAGTKAWTWSVTSPKTMKPKVFNKLLDNWIVETSCTHKIGTKIEVKI